MILPDELLDNFKYAITDEDIPMLEEAYRAGMLASADLADQWYYPVGCDESYRIAVRNLAKAIRRAATNGNSEES